MDQQDVLKIVNPSYTTGKGCLAMLAGTGDTDAIELLKTIDISELQEGESEEQRRAKANIIKSYIVAHDARYGVWNQIARASDAKTIVDLPCGYLPHGLAVARMGKAYYGLDLPVVINDIAPAISRIAEAEEGISRDSIRYCPVDATNFESMRKALEDVEGEITIITDGLLTFFSRSELDEVVRAIRKLLLDKGGLWYTGDAMSVDLMALSYEGVMQGDPDVVRQAAISGGAMRADIDNTNNPFLCWDRARMKTYMENMGFTVEEIDYPRLLPELRSVDSETFARLKKSYEKMIEWRLTPRQEEVPVDPNLPFSVKSTMKDGVFTVCVQGRVDTITAPDLLTKFRDAGAGIEAVHIDVSRMSYISSAGLRVLLMMYKSLKDKDGFKMYGVSDDVREIFETTGFDELLL